MDFSLKNIKDKILINYKIMEDKITDSFFGQRKQARLLMASVFLIGIVKISGFETYFDFLLLLFVIMSTINIGSLVKGFDDFDLAYANQIKSKITDKDVEYFSYVVVSLEIIGLLFSILERGFVANVFSMFFFASLASYFIRYINHPEYKEITKETHLDNNKEKEEKRKKLNIKIEKIEKKQKEEALKKEKEAQEIKRKKVIEKRKKRKNY